MSIISLCLVHRLIVEQGVSSRLIPRGPCRFVVGCSRSEYSPNVVIFISVLSVALFSPIVHITSRPGTGVLRTIDSASLMIASVRPAICSNSIMDLTIHNTPVAILAISDYPSSGML